jgi:pyruvate dehydrogenase E2 component (dihydrolipoamide acetyltransferase)
VKLPELGENLEAAEVAAVLVQVGDRVRREQPLIEVETEKATLEVPAPADGTVAELLVRVGDTINVGQTILRLDSASGASATPPPVDERAAPESPVRQEPTPAETPARPEPAPPPPADSRRADEGAATAAPPAVVESPATTPGRREPRLGPTVPAAPSVRALARQLGIDILQVAGSGPGGRISRDDVKAHAKRIIRSVSAAGPTPALPDFSRWGEVSSEPLSGIRRATARNMSTAWATVPHVTQCDRADISQLESMRRRFNRREEAKGRKLTLTAIVIKTAAAALKQYRVFNASLDLARERLIYKKYVHVGVAVDTERGLLVPVIRDADDKSIRQVVDELAALAARAREKKLGLDEMSGASFTVSNLGGLGTTYFSPIVNWPQVAILGVGRAEQQAVHAEGKFEPRLILPLSLSYDHRIIDGADAARFLRWVAEALEQPLLLLLDE